MPNDNGQSWKEFIRVKGEYWLKSHQTVNLDSARQGDGSIPSSPTNKENKNNK